MDWGFGDFQSLKTSPGEHPQQPIETSQLATLFGSQPIWQPFAKTSAEDLRRAAEKLGQPLPEQLSAFLLEFGFGDIAEELSFRRDWLTSLKDGPLAGHIIFGRDDRGSFYTVDPGSGAIHYFSRSGAGHCQLAKSFLELLQASHTRAYEVVSWAESSELLPNEGAA